jgi:DNA polymerase-3 subunit delta'
VLLVERVERLPETVLSRCQRVPFRPIERQAIEEALVAKGASVEEAETLAAASGGKLGWALQAHEDPSLLEERGRMLDEAMRLAHAGRIERFAWAKEAEGRTPGIRERYMRELGVWETWWRDVLLYGAGGVAGAANPDREAELLNEGKLYNAGEIVTFLKAIAETREYLLGNVDAQLALENLTLELPSRR